MNFNMDYSGFGTQTLVDTVSEIMVLEVLNDYMNEDNNRMEFKRINKAGERAYYVANIASPECLSDYTSVSIKQLEDYTWEISRMTVDEYEKSYAKRNFDADYSSFRNALHFYIAGIQNEIMFKHDDSWTQRLFEATVPYFNSIIDTNYN